MTTLTARPNTALLVVDAQRGPLGGAHRHDEVTATIGGLVGRARHDDVPVVWVQHHDDHIVRGSDDWQLVPGLSPAATEPRVDKSYGDAFEETTLESVLAELAVGRLVVVGAQTDMCIRCTLHGALTRGYDALLVSDAHTTEDLSEWGAPPPEQVIAHTNMYWGEQTAPGRTAGTRTSDAVDFASAD